MIPCSHYLVCKIFYIRTNSVIFFPANSSDPFFHHPFVLFFFFVAFVGLTMDYYPNFLRRLHLLDLPSLL